MTDELEPEKIARLLTQSTKHLDSDTLSALGNARQKALQKQTMHAPVFTLATSRLANMLLPFTSHQWVSAGFLAALFIIGTSYWLHTQEQQIAELDVAILTDDLPIEVFVD